MAIIWVDGVITERAAFATLQGQVKEMAWGSSSSGGSPLTIGRKQMEIQVKPDMGQFVTTFEGGVAKATIPANIFMVTDDGRLSRTWGTAELVVDHATIVAMAKQG